VSAVKVAVIGAGSYVFGLSVLQQALVDHRWRGVALALMDVNADLLEPMAAVGRRMARDSGARAQLTTHTDWPSALDGADFVLCSAARQMQERWATDCDIIDRLLPGHWVTEFGGIAGISYSLRQITLISDLAEAMKRLCPDAWLLTSSNPLPRVCQAAEENGVRTAGFCSASLGGLGSLWRLYHGQDLRFPFTAALAAWDFAAAGVNHFTWLLEFRDRATGADLLEDLRRRLDAGGSTGNPLSEQLARGTRFFPLPHQGHYVDFIAPQGPPPPRHQPYHGTAAEREERIRLLRHVATGEESWRSLLDRPAWERPIDLVAAMAFGKKASFTSLNLVNAGQVPNLPANVFVETPATAAGPEGPVPRTLPLPEAVLPHCAHAALVTDAIVRAAEKRSRRLLHYAVELDPTILDKAAGIRAIDACLEAHGDLLPTFPPGE
jgi:alpha-galactosidase